MERTEQFTSRWGLVLASLGMAVGLPAEQAASVASSGNEGLAFIWMPKLFLGGGVLVVVFFAALAVAALSSLIAMFELGLPSALMMAVFKNQDCLGGSPRP